MPVREVIRIDEERCDGCGECVPACAEGAIAVIDGKARLVSEVLCDGLGACLGHCPQGAITVERVEAPAFDRAAVERHLKGQTVPTPAPLVARAAGASGCPGAATRAVASSGGSALRQWPVQLHLLPPHAPFLRGAELLLAADCVAFALGDFHERLLAGRALAIACPKLDQAQERYLDKLTAMVDDGGVRAITVAVMEVPCCSGLVRLAEEAVRRAQRTIPVRVLVTGVDGSTRGPWTVNGVVEEASA